MKDETCYQDQSEHCQKNVPYIHIKKLIFQNLALEVGILMLQAYGMIVQKKGGPTAEEAEMLLLAS